MLNGRFLDGEIAIIKNLGLRVQKRALEAAETARESGRNANPPGASFLETLLLGSF